MTLSVGRAFHIQLHYHVLSFLDLGMDAASLYQPRAISTEWVDELQHSYIAERTLAQSLQHAPLLVRNLEGLLQHLQSKEGGVFARMANALLSERTEQEHLWLQTSEEANTAIESFLRLFGDDLILLRSALWGRIQKVSPPLFLFHTPALGLHGRGIGGASYRCCAVSLSGELEHAFCQTFHEEVHAISDYEVEQKLAPSQKLSARETHVGAKGFSLHREMERHAVELGDELIRTHSPSHLKAYQRWRDLFGS